MSSIQNLSDNEFLFTSESVTEGHPDKIADQISDSVLDAIFRDDPNGRVACETFVTTGMILVGGEITTDTYVDIPKIAAMGANLIGTFACGGYYDGTFTATRGIDFYANHKNELIAIGRCSHSRSR